MESSDDVRRDLWSQPPLHSKNTLGQNILSLMKTLKNAWASESFSKAQNNHKYIKSHISSPYPKAPLLLSGHLLISGL